MSSEPYADSTSYLQDEFTRYLPARAERLKAEMDAKEARGYVTSDMTIGEKQRPAVQESERRVRLLRKHEAEVRTEIDDRLSATRKM